MRSKTKKQITVLEPQVKEAKEKLAAHVDMLRKQYPLFAATKYPQPMGLDQTALKDKEWVLAYHVTDPGIIIYLTRGKNLHKGLFKPIPRKEIDELVRKFREPMELGSGDSIPEKLSNLTLLPARNSLTFSFLTSSPTCPKTLRLSSFLTALSE